MALFLLILLVKGVFIATDLLLLSSHPLEVGVALAATDVGCNGQTAVRFFFFNTYGTWYSEVELSDSDSTVGLRGGINNPSEKLCL